MNMLYTRSLLRWGFVLLLIGLLTGFTLSLLRNPLLGLGAHLIALFGGLLLVALGIVWRHFSLSGGSARVLFWSAVYGTYMGWGSNMLAAAFGTSRMTPIAGAGFRAEPWQENLVSVLLISTAISTIVMCLVALLGLRGESPEGQP